MNTWLNVRSNVCFETMAMETQLTLERLRRTISSLESLIKYMFIYTVFYVAKAVRSRPSIDF